MYILSAITSVILLLVFWGFIKFLMKGGTGPSMNADNFIEQCKKIRGEK